MATRKVGSVSSVLSAHDFFSPDACQKLEIPEIRKNGQPGIVYLKPISAGDMMAFVGKEKGDEQNSELLILISKCVVDEHGNPLFPGDEASRLRDMSVPVFARLSKAIMKSVTAATEGLGDEGKG